MSLIRLKTALARKLLNTCVNLFFLTKEFL